MCMHAALIAGTALSALGSIQQGLASAQAASAQAKAAEYNATVADMNARAARQAAGADSDRIRAQNERALSSMRAAAAAGGSTMSGSTLGLIGDAAMQMEYDALLRRYQGEVEATAQTNRAGLDRHQADVARAAGTQALIGGGIGAGADILSGYTKYKHYSDAGVIPGLGLR